ncbi:glycine--tRNA ligase subunit beta, partial [Candidatus Poribacteria bacterium]|nr:glycine--tRNA ligase subunit beta [Candidatus Poribacteria bacterium]
SPTLGASGLGWEIWLDGSEVTQYTYFQQMGSVELDPMSIEITYGLERIALDSQNIDSFFDIEWTRDVTYGDVHHHSEVEYSTYYLEEADTKMLFQLFDMYEKEAVTCFDKGLVLPAVDYVLKCSHIFNVLDARKSISVTERVTYIARVRNLARKCARGYCQQREEMGYPMLKKDYPKPEFSESPIVVPEDLPEFSDFLLEIGTEEIPASYIKPALNELENQVKEMLDENRIKFDSACTLGTPRRMILSLTNVSTHQSDRSVEVTGPPKSVAFDDEGNPTKAAEGFARKCGVGVDELQIKETDRGEYVYAVQQEIGRSTAELLSEELPEIISSLNFPKSMHFSSFEDGNLRFARPIRWIVALLGKQIMDFNVGRVKSSNITYGHRFLSEGPIELHEASIDILEEKLKKAGVMADHNRRKEIIKAQVTEIMELESCMVHIDEELLDTVTFLVENPKPIVGTFSEAYLALPVEVLETAMKKHQRYFSLRANYSNEDPSLLPKFITITNGSGDEEVIRHGNERVLRSRLADAEFFYKEDQKIRLADKLERLKHVVFQVELGNLYDKSQRMKELSGYIFKILYEKMSLSNDVGEDAMRSAELCKVDLITQMVIEFPSLQGIMGGYYASNSGENPQVAEAIRNHYYPTSPDSELPGSIIGDIVSIADKLDTIVGYFGIGLIPSGSQDPYALRRQAAGIVRILANSNYPLSPDLIIEKSIALYEKFSEPTELKNKVLEFFKARVSNLLSDRGFDYDLVDSVMSVDMVDVGKCIKRAEAMAKFRERPDFIDIYNAFNRVIRILPENLPKTGVVREDYLEDQSEVDLYRSINRTKEQVEQAAANGDYEEVLASLASLRGDIDKFFDDVLVMVDNE